MFDFLPQKQIPPDEDSAIQQKVWELIKAFHRKIPLPKTFFPIRMQPDLRALSKVVHCEQHT